MAALYTCLLMLGGEIIKQAIKHWHRPAHAATEMLRIDMSRALVTGARSGAQVAIVVAVINVLVEMFVTTGLGQKMSHLMLLIADGSLWLLLVVAALMCLILGCGVPTSAAYILVALLGAPALVKLGVPLLAAHLFVFFYANLSAITPPTALAALVAANIAGGGFLPHVDDLRVAGAAVLRAAVPVRRAPRDHRARRQPDRAGRLCMSRPAVTAVRDVRHQRLHARPAPAGTSAGAAAVGVLPAGVGLDRVRRRLRADRRRGAGPVLGPKRAFTIKSYARDEPGRSLGPIGRYLVRRAEQGQTVD